MRFIGWDRDEIEITGTVEEDVEGLDIDSDGERTHIEVELMHHRGGMHRAAADLEIRVPRDSRVEAESVSASLQVESIKGPVRIESVNGDVRIEGSVREVEVSTVASAIVVESDTDLSSGQFETVSGKIDFRGGLSPDGRFSFESMSGSVTLRLPARTSAEFDVETFSGDIDNELGPPAERSGDWIPGKTLSFSLGAGGARVSVESFSGRVRLLRE